MLKNVKSYYIIEIFFSYLEEKQKLKLVKKNKNLQKYLNITINNYIHFTGKYIIYESKGKGKEYCKDNLIFEGEYLNGERNGKGKEYYYNGKLKFEGEYLNGERNGKGKEYYYNGKLKFEGEYLNGERNGKGKEYYYNGKLKCDGEYLNGIELLGTEYDANGKIKNQFNKVKGIGKTYKLFRLYEGEYLNGKRNG